MSMKVLDRRERTIMSAQYTVTPGQQVQITNARSDRRYEICLSSEAHGGANMELYIYFDGVAGTAGGRAFVSGGHGNPPTETLTLSAVFIGQLIYGNSAVINAEVSELRPGNQTKVTATTLGSYFFSDFVHIGAWSTMSIYFPNAATVDITVIEKVI